MKLATGTYYSVVSIGPTTSVMRCSNNVTHCRVSYSTHDITRADFIDIIKLDRSLQPGRVTFMNRYICITRDGIPSINNPRSLVNEPA